MRAADRCLILQHPARRSHPTLRKHARCRRLLLPPRLLRERRQPARPAATPPRSWLDSAARPAISLGAHACLLFSHGRRRSLPRRPGSVPPAAPHRKEERGTKGAPKVTVTIRVRPSQPGFGETKGGAFLQGQPGPKHVQANKGVFGSRD